MFVLQNPQEIEPWKGIWEAVNTYVCPQLEGPGGQNVIGNLKIVDDIDFLTLNFAKLYSFLTISYTWVTGCKSWRK